MNTYIGRRPWFFPFPLTLICVVFIYGLAVPLSQWVENSEPGSASVFLLLLVFVLIMIYRFIVYILHEATSTSQKFYGWIDGFFALTHIWAGFTMTIAILAPDVTTHFIGIPTGTKGYDLFWTYGYANSVLLFVTIGQKVTGTTALGALPAIITAITGVSWIAIFLGLVMRFVYIPPPKIKEVPIHSMVNGFATPAHRTRQAPRPRGGRPLHKKQQAPFNSYIAEYSK